MNVSMKLRKIKLIAFDFDGVFTDNCVYVNQDGQEMVRCWRSDGIGLQRLREIGVKTVVISSEINSVVKKRCEKLGIESVTGEKDKLSALKKILQRESLSVDQVCFVGNDLPDLECLKFVGFPVAVPGSAPEVLEIVSYTTKNPGGRGAVREICDMIYKAQRKGPAR